MTKTIVICLPQAPASLAEPLADWPAWSVFRPKAATGTAFWAVFLRGLGSGLGVTPRETGLVNYPAPVPDDADWRFALPCSAHADPDRHCLPPTLRGSLADYRDGAVITRKPMVFQASDQALARQAMAAVIVREHAARLARRFGPSVLVVGFTGLLARDIGRRRRQYHSALYLRQAMAHGRRLARDLNARRAMLICCGPEPDGDRTALLAGLPGATS